MAQVQDNFTVCDECGGAIPAAADKVRGVNATLIIGGVPTTFQNLDFCCTAHMGAWIASKPAVSTPSPLYAPPPANV